MAEQELIERIARTISPMDFVEGFGDPDRAIRKAAQVLVLIKEAGYVQLADDQFLPASKLLLSIEQVRGLKDDGWRRIMEEK